MRGWALALTVLIGWSISGACETTDRLNGEFTFSDFDVRGEIVVGEGAGASAGSA